MSRSNRMDYFACQQRPSKAASIKDTLSKRMRRLRRHLIENRMIPDPSKQPPKNRWRWELEGFGVGFVRARTKSEARSQIKTIIGLKPFQRLPVGIVITIIENNHATKPSGASTS